ncbi:lipid-A-disaccharide synthase N-terminal domain-containing protein [Adhaeribacter radiodurans]|uniref:Lipid-A-disaccharide synthase N-terminal domain-containing protein n=1 Tax=Adhaeribacter radiodurans TaxID=2745197 RepID=A0A7L7L765_9BACT|nr:lipid-A-disaccharide synthase N-terminal domain-containing protein [Adhaeribacter radiodurans]QMU28594.1 lipid-A-disaccharide synthase N-terminal domain-containing protein [Adhaeribacter radiodurans]
MTKTDYFIYGIGLLAQLLFSARLLLQWIQSEKAGKVLSPASFWTTSIIASILLMIYGALREDVVVIGGQVISYFIYLRNLKLKNLWSEVPFVIRWLAILFPFFTFAWLFLYDNYTWNHLLEHNKISGALIAWGGLGQVVFTLRFVYQWYFSERLQQSVIPNGFWLISLVGSLMIMSYAVIRLDPVLFIGQIFGVVVYIRNFIIGTREKSSSKVIQQQKSEAEPTASARKAIP